MGARPKLTQKRRTQMLEAAAEVIGERGLCDTRIADIAERAGLSPALVVYYFGSKEKVLTEALAYAEDLFYIEAFRELTGIEGATEKLMRLIELACPAVERSDIDAYWALWVELWSRALRNDEAARKREALDQRWRTTIAEVVREGQRSGEFAPCDPERFATYLAALMDGLSLQGLLHDSAVSSELINRMCLDAAAQQLGFDPDAPDRRGEEGSGLKEFAAEG
ncbi:MAG TPA: TetR/AcrR family transcriptional regulator [Rubrobacteraceae bacterium]|nr:TetR/AcrR family transcriptional regulator [Rubrobacteraceae bacterium]